jgi:two-component system cell cycle sensor histidine kinase/response regulator CckA
LSLDQKAEATGYPRAERELRPAGSAATILVVDDDPAMRMILALSLKLFGYVALSAENGESALTIASAHPEIRVILLDVVMCGLSGRALADQLEGILPNSRILFCSGHPAATLKRYEIDADSLNFLQKPCRPPELQQKIEELLAAQ